MMFEIYEEHNTLQNYKLHITFHIVFAKTFHAIDRFNAH